MGRAAPWDPFGRICCVRRTEATPRFKDGESILNLMLSLGDNDFKSKWGSEVVTLRLFHHIFLC